MGEQGRELRFELFQPVEVADEGREVTGQQSQRETPRQIVDKRDGAAKGQSKQSRDCQVESGGGNDAGQFDQRTEDDVAVIVVIDITPGEPGVIGRHVGAAQNGVEKGQFHRFLPAEERIPEIGVE